MSFQSIKPSELSDNPFTLFGTDWMLLTAEHEGKINTMTISWGTIGIFWNKPVVIVGVRPERYTYELIEAAPVFSVAAFDKRWREQLNLCGTKSGRDMDKMNACGFTTAKSQNIPYINEGRLNLLCKKMGAFSLSSDFFAEGSSEILSQYYESAGLHKLYFGEIKDILAEK